MNVVAHVDLVTSRTKQNMLDDVKIFAENYG